MSIGSEHGGKSSLQLPSLRVVLLILVVVVAAIFFFQNGHEAEVELLTWTVTWPVRLVIIVSIVLGLPTVGPLLLRSLMTQDMFLAGTFVMLLSILTVIGQLLSDILLVFVDPRIRFET